MLIEYLKSAHEKYFLYTTQDGDEAYTIALTENPDLIITDWELIGSNLNGLQLVSKLKKFEATKQIPVIMATTYTSSEMLAKAMREGVVDYIRKPIDKIELLARVRAALLLKKMSRAEIIKEKVFKTKVLFLAANPTNTSRLKLGKEYKIISHNLLKLGIHRDRYEIHQEFAVTIDSLLQSLLEYKPNVVHFSGHSDLDGIYLEDEIGNAKKIHSSALESLFEQFKTSLHCIILNACYSKDQAIAISKYVPYTIGMENSISDSASLAFSLGFYKALGAGEDYVSSYNFGLVNIKLEGIKGNELPILITTDK